MKKLYTRVCNFYYGKNSIDLVKKKKSLALNGNNNISFDQIEILSRNSKKKISINELNDLPKLIKQKIKKDLKNILKKKKIFQI